MKLPLLVLASLYLTTEAANTRCRQCPLVSCLLITEEDCKPGEVFVKSDGYCHCCDSCVKADCPTNMCHYVRCVPVQPEDCDPKTQVYERPDGVCNCCGRCVDKKRPYN